MYNSFYLCIFIPFQSRSIKPFFVMRKFSIPGAIRIDAIFEVGLERPRCGEEALGVRFGGKTHPELIRDNQHKSSSDQAFAANSSKLSQ
jgi:hypothetical protein